MDKNSASKMSTFSIDSNSSTLSLRLIGKGSFTDQQKSNMPNPNDVIIKQYHEAEEESSGAESDDGEDTERSLKQE